MISDNFYVSVPAWFLFLYFIYWYVRSFKRFWDCNFNFVNVLELHQSMEARNDYNKRVLIWRFTLVLIKINYGQIGDQTGLFYTKNPVFYTGGNKWFLLDLSDVPARLGISDICLIFFTCPVGQPYYKIYLSDVSFHWYRTNVNVEAWWHGNWLSKTKYYKSDLVRKYATELFLTEIS